MKMKHKAIRPNIETYEPGAFYCYNPTGFTLKHPNTPSVVPDGLNRIKTSRAMNNPQPGGWGLLFVKYHLDWKALKRNR